MINSVPISAIELINIVPYNPLISKCQIKVCWVGDTPNRNRSIITKEVAKDLANSLPGSPIVGYYNEETEDFEEHNKIIELKNGKFNLKPTTQPYGFVDLNAKVWFQKFSDEGVEHEYLVTEGWLWTGQFPECRRIIEQGNNQSMELDQQIIDAHWTKDENGKNQFFIINEAIISKLCILGEEYEPCFEGAQITNVQFSFEEDFKQQLFSMMTEIKNILNKGGAPMVNAENTPVVEEPVATEPVIEEPVVDVQDPVVEEPAVPAEEPVVADPVVESEPEGEPTEPVAAEPVAEFNEDTCPECGKPVTECECGKDKPAQYNLDEIPEYIELNNNYSALETKYNELLAAHESLTAENTALVAFKAKVEKKEKEDLIAKFYMLSDDLKKDVVENIDSYSLEDIEAKLSVICVRNKVSFDLDDDKNDNNTTTYNLNSGDYSNVEVPAWVKAIQNSVANN